VVNVASQCGLTKQYAGLESLYAGKQDEGLVVLGFPANDFMGQEPGTNEEIATFCSTEYGVTFPMFQKIAVTGDGAHPLFRSLTAQSEAPTWNFTKYLLDREGNLVQRFDPRTTPDDPALRAEIDRLLSAG
jgi:glutathione peroxidase